MTGQRGATAGARAWRVLSVLGRILTRALMVFFGALGAIEGRSNAVLPPDMPPDRREDYRP